MKLSGSFASFRVQGFAMDLAYALLEHHTQLIPEDELVKLIALEGARSECVVLVYLAYGELYMSPQPGTF